MKRLASILHHFKQKCKRTFGHTRAKTSIADRTQNLKLLLTIISLFLLKVQSNFNIKALI